MKSFKDYLNKLDNINNTENINQNGDLSESPFLYRIYDNGIIYGEMQDFYFYVPKNDEFKKVSYFKPGKKLGLEISRKGAEELFRKKTGYGLVENGENDKTDDKIDEATNKAEKYLKRQEEQAEYRKSEIKKVLSKSPFPIIGLEEALSTITTTMMYGLNRDLYIAEGGVENDPKEYEYWNKKLNNNKKETIKAQEDIKLFLAEINNILKMIDFNKDQGVSYYLKK